MEFSICPRVSGDRPRNSTPIPWPSRWWRTTAEQVMNVSALGRANRRSNMRPMAYVPFILRNAPTDAQIPERFTSADEGALLVIDGYGTRSVSSWN